VGIAGTQVNEQGTITLDLSTWLYPSQNMGDRIRDHIANCRQQADDFEKWLEDNPNVAAMTVAEAKNAGKIEVR
jgi:hypothetical protein